MRAWLPGHVASDHEDAIYLPIDFATGAHFDSHEQRKPYVHVLQVPPPRDILNGVQAGYEVPRDADADGRGNATATMAQVQRGALAHGEVTYGVKWGTVTSVQESMRLGLARSHLNLTKGAVKIGEEVNVTADFQGLYDEVLVLGTTITGWSVDVSIFDPAQPFVPFGQMEPSFSGTYGANGQLNFEPDLTEVVSIAPWNLAQAADIKTLAVANFTFAPPKGSFFGPHAIVVQANFVINDGLGNSMAQSVRQLAVIDVLPDGGQSGTAIYWTILECWLPDW